MLLFLLRWCHNQDIDEDKDDFVADQIYKLIEETLLEEIIGSQALQNIIKDLDIKYIREKNDDAILTFTKNFKSLIETCRTFAILQTADDIWKSCLAKFLRNYCCFPTKRLWFQFLKVIFQDRCQLGYFLTIQISHFNWMKEKCAEITESLEEENSTSKNLLMPPKISRQRSWITGQILNLNASQEQNDEDEKIGKRSMTFAKNLELELLDYALKDDPLGIGLLSLQKDKCCLFYLIRSYHEEILQGNHLPRKLMLSISTMLWDRMIEHRHWAPIMEEIRPEVNSICVESNPVVELWKQKLNLAQCLYTLDSVLVKERSFVWNTISFEHVDRYYDNMERLFEEIQGILKCQSLHKIILQILQCKESERKFVLEIIDPEAHVNPNRICMICMDLPSNIELPCAHKICINCKTKLPRCPYCRTKIPGNENLDLYYDEEEEE